MGSTIYLTKLNFDVWVWLQGPGQRQHDPFAFGIRSRRPHFKLLADHGASIHVRNKKGDSETP